MTRSIPYVVLAAALSTAFSPAAQAQFFGGFGYHPQPMDLLHALARQGGFNRQPYVANSCCHPSQHGYSNGYEPSSCSSSYADLRVQDELVHARTFYEKRRIRQQYLDEQRERQRLTMQDVQRRREQHEASLAMMELNREIACDRARRQAPGRTDVREVNPVSGDIHWPATLRDSRFAAARLRLETIFAERANYEEAAWDSSSEIPRLTRDMTDKLQTMVRDLPSSEYVAAKTFLKKLEYESRFAPPTAGLVAR